WVSSRLPTHRIECLYSPEFLPKPVGPLPANFGHSAAKVSMTGRGANRTLPCGAAYFPTKGRGDVSPLLIRRDHVGDMRPTRLAKDRGDLVDRFLEALDLQPRLGAARCDKARSPSSRRYPPGP